MTRLDYEAPPESRPRLGWAPGVAFALSLAATASLGGSLIMYVFGRNAGLRETVQMGLAWISLALAASGLAAAVLACFARPRGDRVVLTFLILLGYGALLLVTLAV